MKYLRQSIYYGNKCHVEEHAAPAFGKNRQRPPRKADTTKEQEKLNDEHAAKRLRMKIVCNFIDHEDIFFTLEHSLGVKEEQVKKARTVFLDEMRKFFQKQGKELKYIWVTEKQGCWHHHMIMSKTDLDTIRKFWKKATEGMRREKENRVVLSPLDPFDEYRGLAKYLIEPEKPSRKENPTPEEMINAKQKRRKGARRYSCSKNLEKPVIETKEIKRITKTEPKPPKGYKLLDWNKWCDSFGEMHAQYDCVWASPGSPPKKRKKVRKRE